MIIEDKLTWILCNMNLPYPLTTWPDWRLRKVLFKKRLRTKYWNREKKCYKKDIKDQKREHSKQKCYDYGWCIPSECPYTCPYNLPKYDDMPF